MFNERHSPDAFITPQRSALNRNACVLEFDISICPLLVYCIASVDGEAALHEQPRRSQRVCDLVVLDGLSSDMNHWTLTTL